MTSDTEEMHQNDFYKSLYYLFDQGLAEGWSVDAITNRTNQALEEWTRELYSRGIKPNDL